MGIFDALTGDASKRAARNNAYAIQTGLTQGTNSVSAGYDQANNTLLNGSGPSALTALTSGIDKSTDALNRQYNDTQGYLGGIQGLYQPLVQSGQQASDARADALGLNGADGSARAKAAFTGSLGYNAGLDTGLDSVMRLASARGNLAGGNTSQDLFNYGADYQNRQAGSYLDRLSGVASNLNTGLAGQATGLGLQGQASQQQGSALGTLGTAYGTGAANIFNNAAQLDAQKGNALAGLTNFATGQYVGNNNQRAAGENQASSNAIGGLLSLGSLLTGTPLGGAGGGGGGSGNANVSPFASNPLLSGIDRLTSFFR